MRFSTSFMAAGLTASVIAAPVFDSHKHGGGDYNPWNECEDGRPTHSPSAKGLSATISLSVIASSSVVASSSVRSSVSTTHVLSSSAVSSPIVSSIAVSTSVGVLTSSSSSSNPVASSIASSPVAPSPVVSSSVVSSSASSRAAGVVTSSSASIPSPSSSVSSSIPVTTSPDSKLVTSSVASSSTKSTATTSSSAVVGTSSSSSNGTLQWFGVNESGAEFGSNIPGTLRTDYTWPLTSSIQILMDKGMNIFRIPFLMERLAQGTMTASLDATYLADLTTIVNFITAAGGHAVVDPHNFGRYDGTVFTSTSDFQTFWTNVATEFKSNDNVIFDCNNEFHDEPSNTLVAELNQACIDGVRAAGATTQYIFVEGTSYTGAWTWVSSGNGDAMVDLTDPSDKIVYEMHQYLDSDGSGTSSTCVSSTIGAERIAAATSWLQANGKKGIIGEFAGGANSVCETAVTGMLDALEAASDVWMGAMWWGGGPWWGDYIFSMEPEDGTAYVAYIDTLDTYC